MYLINAFIVLLNMEISTSNVVLRWVKAYAREISREISEWKYKSIKKTTQVQLFDFPFTVPLSVYFTVPLSVYFTVPLSVYFTVPLSVYFTVPLHVYFTVSLFVYFTVPLYAYFTVPLFVYFTVPLHVYFLRLIRVG